MQRVIVSVVVMSMVFSCSIVEIGGDSGDRPSGGHIWGGMDSSQDGTPGLRTISYVTALDYQKGYDWRSDQSVGSVKCSLVVYSDNVPVMKVPVGDAYEVSSDPDMHRIIGGHLYTDYSTETETVIKKDGRQLFRYPGRESVCGLESIGDDIYILGQSREGSGFSLRKNGETVISREDGYVIGSLVNDSDSLCFAFYERIRTADGFIGRYYAFVDGKVSQMALRDDIVRIWDVAVRKDRIIYLATLVGIPFPVVIDGGSMMTLAMPKGATVVSCRLFCSEETVVVEGMYRLPDGKVVNALWQNGKMVSSFSGDQVISAIEISDGGIFCVINPSRYGESGKIYRAGEIFDIPRGYVVMGNGCVKVMDGIMNVGLSSTEGKSPMIWKDGQMDSLKINGYLSAISTTVSLPN